MATAPIPKLQANPDAIVVWGSNSANQIKFTPAGNDFKRIATGGNIQSLAIRKDGSLILWSLLGGNNVADPNAPAGPIPAGVRFIDAVLSVTHGVAVADDGTLYPFGHFAQPPSITTPPPPNTEPAGLKANQDLAEAGHSVATGGGFCVVIDENKNLCQWIAVPDPANPGKFTPTKTDVPPGKFKKVAARNDYTLALSVNGDLYGWGGGFDAMWDAGKYLQDWLTGNIGTVTYYYLDSKAVPAGGLPPDPGHGYVDVAAGNVYKPEGVPHILALRRNGSVSGWGRNTLGQALGAPTGVNFKAIAAGVDFSIGLDEHGLIHHWGDPGPQIGLTSAGSPICELSPVPEGRFRAIGAGSHHAAAVQAPGTGSP